MDRTFEHAGTTFFRDELKAAENERKHGISFEKAVTVLDDPLFLSYKMRVGTRSKEMPRLASAPRVDC
ncbi:MAG: BrnT family toxin [Steroidobacteraceae bacterium]